MLNLAGRWEKLSPAFGPFKNREVELNIDQGCLIWGNRVIIPRTTERVKKLA